MYVAWIKDNPDGEHQVLYNYSKCICVRCLLGLQWKVDLRARAWWLRSAESHFPRNGFAIWNSYLQSHFLLFIYPLHVFSFFFFLWILGDSLHCVFCFLQHERRNDQTNGIKHDRSWTVHASSLILEKTFGTKQEHTHMQSPKDSRTGTGQICMK